MRSRPLQWVKWTLGRAGPNPGAWAVCFAVAAVALNPAPGSGQVAPDDPWRTLETAHFRITFPAGLEALADRAGVRAEEAYASLGATLVRPRSGRVDVVLTDHLDVSNGFAGMSPWRRIVLYARPPTDLAGLQYFDEWLELVMVHELAHILHLDHQGTLSRITRGLFGRPPIEWPAFPQSTMPSWAVEGLATWYESALTGAGRLRGTDHEMVLRTAALEGGLEDLGQAGGDSPVWPGGNRYYIYGSRFFADYLSRQAGEAGEAGERGTGAAGAVGPAAGAGREDDQGLGPFVHAIGDQWLPLRINAAAEDAFQASFSGAWEDWSRRSVVGAAEVRGRLGARAPLTVTAPVSSGGWEQFYPRIREEGIVFARADRKSDAQLRLWTPTGGERKLQRTNGTATLDVAPDGTIVYAQLEYRDPYRIRSDLYTWHPEKGERRLTHGQRLNHPSVEPRGGRVVAVQEGEGTNRLVLVDLASGGVTPLVDFDPAVHWTMPSWSPDGRWIAVSRWVPGGLWDLGLVDPETGGWRGLTDDRALDLAPSWAPDGTLLFSSDRSGIANVFAMAPGPNGEAGTLRQVTNLLTGAGYPVTDGEWIYLSVYHADGWAIERLPWDPATWFEPFPVDPRFERDRRLPGAPPPDWNAFGGRAPDLAPVDSTTGAPGPYRALGSVLPRYWFPLYSSSKASHGYTLMNWGVGAQVQGVDLVGRHEWSASFRTRVDRGQTDWTLDYAFAGLGTPILGGGLSQRWDASGPFNLPAGETTIPVSVEDRERSADVFVTLPRRRMRSSLTVSGVLSLIRRDFQVRDLQQGGLLSPGLLRRPVQDFGQAALVLGYSNTRTHAFSVSPEDGVRLSVRLRTRQDLTVADSLTGVVGWDGSYDDVTARLSGYWALNGPGFASHVLAARVSGGYAQGAGADAFHFDLGGAAGGAIEGLGPLGQGNLLFPLRGYDSGARSGAHIVSASAEYRFPIAVLHRGLGAFPLYIDRLMGNLFVDLGNAWDPDLGVPGHDNPPGDWLASAGAEVRVRLTPLWLSGLDLRAGLAVPLVESSGLGFYVRVGPSF